MELQEVSLPSGAKLKLNPAPFADAKRLYQAVLAEAGGIELKSGLEYTEVIKQAVCTGFSSPLIERALEPCLKRCIYEAREGTTHQVVDDTFEPVERREDYAFILAAVAKENLTPFFKSLFAEFQKGMKVINAFHESKSMNQTS